MASAKQGKAAKKTPPKKIAPVKSTGKGAATSGKAAAGLTRQPVGYRKNRAKAPVARGNVAVPDHDARMPLDHDALPMGVTDPE
jgi:hypothetical protein